MRKCMKLFPLDVKSIPIEMKSDPTTAIFLYPNLFNNGPLNIDNDMPKA